MNAPHRILFVCHGNICRSTMAEFVMKDLVSRRGMADAFVIGSAATHDDEIGSPVHHGTRAVLEALSCRDAAIAETAASKAACGAPNPNK